MASLLLYFYWHSSLQRILPDWQQKEFVFLDRLESHAHYRRISKRYRAKKRLVRSLWTATGGILVLFPTPPIWGGAVLFSTCLSFAILDESK
ncbi:hypothetical protein [Marinomonas ostreistagni]|uniref:hypothetical protein n=1 Tax=Marinomonas ostreistagni TaxID=359209 RepID=UPI00194EB4AF|nr:hypothetical protein [Marinomonas ostreistagni]MBM6550335.1 hypothetical protein [Marinomonas ostreistagni]